MRRISFLAIFLCVLACSIIWNMCCMADGHVEAFKTQSRVIGVKLKIPNSLQALSRSTLSVQVGNEYLKSESVFENIITDPQVRHTIAPSGLLQWRLVRVPTHLDVERVRKELLNNTDVAIAEIDPIAVPTDISLLDYLHYEVFDGTREEYFASQWGLTAIHAPEVWSQLDIESMVPTNIAIIDSGAEIGHKDLGYNVYTNPGEIPADGLDNDHDGIVDNFDCMSLINGEYRGDCYDDLPHGTHVAGIMGGYLNGSGIVGVLGPTQEKIKMVPEKFLRLYGGFLPGGNVSDGAQLIAYNIAHHIPVSSNSWGAYDESQLLYDTIQAAEYAGHILVFAAGNDGEDLSRFSFYPTVYAYNPHTNRGFKNLIAVAATKEDGSRALFSNYGPQVRIAAPGNNILSTWPGGEYHVLSGTSMATPHVGAVVGMLCAQFPKDTSRQIVDRLLNGAYAEPKLRNYISGASMLDMRCLTITKDAIPPPVRNLQLVYSSSDTIAVQFEQSADVARFQVVYSPIPLTNETYRKGHLVFNVPVPEPNADHYTCEIMNLSSRTEYYVYACAVNRVGQRSNLVGIKVVTQ